MMSPIIIVRDCARGARRGASPAIAVASSARAPTVAGFHRMLGRPRHVDPAPEPDAVAPMRVLEKTNEADGAGAATSQTIMRSDRHQFGMRRPIAIEQGEVEKIVRRRDAAVHVEADVIRPVETADEKVHAVRDVDPIGQLVIQRLATAEKTALYDQKPASLRAWPTRHPAEGPFARDCRNARDGRAYMRAFDLFRRLPVVDPAKPMRDSLVAGFTEGLRRFAIAFGRLRDGEHADLDAGLRDDAQRPVRN